LIEKVNLLETSNVCLFKELDQSINGISAIGQNTQLEVVNDYLDGTQKSIEIQKKNYEKDSYKAEIV